jgi:octaprenyl-diphosphate synthase
MNPLTTYLDLYKPELKRLEEKAATTLDIDTSLIKEVGSHLIGSGGKRIRPILTILSAKLFGYDGQRHINLALAVELLHSATLLHDDVVDESILRRDLPTANAKFGNSPAVLVGDFLLARAFQIMSYDEDIRVLKCLSDASATITEGEVKQLMNKSRDSISYSDYMLTIEAKTAALFAAACEVGGIINDRSLDETKAIKTYGNNLGIAFQIADDLLDYTGEDIGKTVGDDFRERKTTLPVILANQDNFWENSLEDAIAILHKTGALEQTRKIALDFSHKAISELVHLPNNQYRKCLEELADFVVQRSK